uniref:Uncharacterized protein n=1 Tax=Caenorhabditis japonica TaxID=281687 RepID=A0A8R1HWY3_CAEJA
MYMSFNFFFLNIFLHQIIAKEINKLKFQELNEVSPGSENSTDGTFPNTQLFVKWDNWSCCSACCCPKSLCGQLATADKCNSVKSVKHRRGHFTLKRLADTGNRELENLFKSANEARLIEAMKINGIEKKLHDSKLALIKKLGVSSETQLVFQILDCKDDIQKKDCWELATCRFGTSNMLPEKEIATIVERDVCENATIFVLRDAHNILSLQSDKLYSHLLTDYSRTIAVNPPLI